MAGSDTEDYVLVSRWGEEQGSEGQTLEGEVRQRVSHEPKDAPPAPTTPVQVTRRQEQARSAGLAAGRKPGVMEVVSASFIYWLLVGVEEGAAYCTAVKQVVVRGTRAAGPLARRALEALRTVAAVAAAATQQYARLIRARDWHGLTQLAGSTASGAASHAARLVAACASASQFIYRAALADGQAAVAFVVYAIKSPGQCWKVVLAACWSTYLRIDPNQHTAAALRSAALHMVAFYNRVDPGHQVERVFCVHIYPAVAKAAGYGALAAHKVQPLLVAAWERAGPAGRCAWVEAKQAWQAPGAGWVCMLAAAAAVVGCLVAVVGVL